MINKMKDLSIIKSFYGGYLITNGFTCLYGFKDWEAAYKFIKNKKIWTSTS